MIRIGDNLVDERKIDYVYTLSKENGYVLVGFGGINSIIKVDDVEKFLENILSVKSSSQKTPGEIKGEILAEVDNIVREVAVREIKGMIPSLRIELSATLSKMTEPLSSSIQQLTERIAKVEGALSALDELSSRISLLEEKVGVQEKDSDGNVENEMSSSDEKGGTENSGTGEGSGDQ